MPRVGARPTRHPQEAPRERGARSPTVTGPGRHPHPTTPGAKRPCRGVPSQGQRRTPGGQGWPGLPKDLPEVEAAAVGRRVPCRGSALGFGEPGLLGGRSEGPASVRGCRLRGGRQGAPEPAPARSLLAAATPPAPIPGRPGRTAREGRVSRCVSPAPTSAPPGEIVSLWQISRYKSRPDSVRKSSFRVSGPSTLFVSKADLSPSFPLHVSVGNSIKYDSKQITLAVSFPQRLSKSWIRNARNGEGARRSRHHWGWFLLGEEAPPSPVPTVGSCRDGPSGQLEEPAAQSWFCSHLPTQDPLSSASKRFQFSWTVRGT